jgi:tellurite resistance protein
VTGKSAFTEEEWKLVLQGPTSAGMMVAGSESGGTIRESFSMAKAYAEARSEHGESELLDTIVSTRPEVDRTRVHSREELSQRALQHLQDALAAVEAKATPEEVEDYKRFVLGLARRVAEAHKGVGDSEQHAIEQIAGALGTDVPPS